VKLFDPSSRKWRPIAKGVRVHNVLWSRDGKFVYYQDETASQRQVYRVAVSRGSIEAVAAWKQLVRSDWSLGSFGGLTPDGQPVATFTRRRNDIYGLDLDLP
jgi:sugar lactone lactonase YvrE